jgi:hypothetical protein
MRELLLEALKSDIVERAVKTFVQTAVAVIITGYATVDSFEGVKALGVAAIAAGLSAAWNTVAKKQ